MFTSQDHQLTKISSILQAWFLNSVNIINMTSEKVTAIYSGIISDQETQKKKDLGIQV